MVPKKLLSALRNASYDVGQYPGCHWDDAPKKFRKLEEMGLVRLWMPHNPSHKDRAVITPAGKAALAATPKEQTDAS